MTNVIAFAVLNKDGDFMSEGGLNRAPYLFSDKAEARERVWPGEKLVKVEVRVMEVLELKANEE